MPLCVFLLLGGRVVTINLTNQSVDLPGITTNLKETQLDAAVRLSKTNKVTEVTLSKVWTMEQVILALALVGLSFKKFLIVKGKVGLEVATSERISDLLIRLRAADDTDRLRYALQQLLNGDAQVRLERPPTEPIYERGEPGSEEGVATFVG